MCNPFVLFARYVCWPCSLYLFKRSLELSEECAEPMNNKNTKYKALLFIDLRCNIFSHSCVKVKLIEIVICQTRCTDCLAENRIYIDYGMVWGVKFNLLIKLRSFVKIERVFSSSDKFDCGGCCWLRSGISCLLILNFEKVISDVVDA